MSPATTVCVVVLAGAGAAATVDGAVRVAGVGIVRTWPMRMNARASRPLAAAIAATVVE